MNINRGLKVIVGALLVASLAFVGNAHAKSFSMSGEWFQNRGALVDIPINGGPTLCIGGDIKTGCVGVFKPANGGIPGSAAISAMGVNPAAFTIPPGAFAQTLGSQRTPVGIIPTVVQLATAFTFQAPPNAAQATGAAPTFLTAQPAVFQKNAWSNDPGQTAGVTPRAAANFAWCPGVGGPACPSGLAATGSADVQGIVSYTAGANAFGGTMGMMLKGTGGTTSIVAGSTGGTGMIPFLAHLPIPANTGFVNPQAQGVSYAYANSIVLGSAQLYIGFMTSSAMGLITSTGPPLTTGGAAMSPVTIAGDTNNNFGFPWTTGTISVMNTETLNGGMQSGTLVAAGEDNRTGAGKGTIVMVAGGTTHRVLSGMDFESLEVAVLNFSDGTPTPSMGPAGLATVATLMALTAGYAIRGRFGRKN
ncbi:MAG: hypothetical protein QF570_03255 [Myxococcota bacterium]|jgi:hypothetical protein|nr:hypothetical protein [Myxococcota bacterium]